ncbi:hypothetical protein EJ05DRAFT_23698 [Pseudovirgaria hyperparasitica]|uniref:Uncharacterized protein n=1 Tax=Pseudovirgaria hyperparasitica TaxID=470096 RepID=A0A6A6WLK3_9PEZI|nr:uncharacterized protein EJ05DRAFT_23698 [Pseudovirgaria hyperparasitica]KAF2763026.1 hypothetical protein EJ05DRAFT_23698 [Pseudovirgaria hyperparasitica]
MYFHLSTMFTLTTLALLIAIFTPSLAIRDVGFHQACYTSNPRLGQDFREAVTMARQAFESMEKWNHGEQNTASLFARYAYEIIFRRHTQQGAWQDNMNLQGENQENDPIRQVVTRKLDELGKLKQVPRWERADMLIFCDDSRWKQGQSRDGEPAPWKDELLGTILYEPPRCRGMDQEYVTYPPSQSHSHVVEFCQGARRRYTGSEMLQGQTISTIREELLFPLLLEMTLKAPDFQPMTERSISWQGVLSLDGTLAVSNAESYVYLILMHRLYSLGLIVLEMGRGTIGPIPGDGLAWHLNITEPLT